MKIIERDIQVDNGLLGAPTGYRLVQWLIILEKSFNQLLNIHEVLVKKMEPKKVKINPFTE